MFSIIKKEIIFLKNFILDALFPWHCLYCLKEGDDLICKNCLKMIPIFSDFQCPYCQKLITNFNHHCSYSKLISALGAVSFYENPVLKKAIHTFKYQRILKTKEVLTNLMIRFLENSCFFENLLTKEKENILVIAVPLNKKREIKRGFNQAEILAEEISSYFQLNYQKKILIRKFNNLPQASLKDTKEREKNVKNIFKIDPKKRKILKNKIILLIDDVYTTGATMKEIGKILKKAKVKKIIGLVLAK